MRNLLTLARRAAAGAALAALAHAAPVAAQDAPPPSAFSETHGAWILRCVADAEDGDSARRCAMEQRFIWRDPETGRESPLLTVTLTPAPGEDGVATLEATVTTPFGLLFAPGLRLSADDAAPATLAFRFCLPDGCLAQARLAPETLWSFRAGVTLRIVADPASGDRPFHVEGSLDGFSAAYARLAAEAAR